MIGRIEDMTSEEFDVIKKRVEEEASKRKKENFTKMIEDVADRIKYNSDNVIDIEEGDYKNNYDLYEHRIIITFGKLKEKRLLNE